MNLLYIMNVKLKKTYSNLWQLNPITWAFLLLLNVRRLLIEARPDPFLSFHPSAFFYPSISHISNIYPLYCHQVQPKEFHPHSLNTLSYYYGSIAAVKDCLQYFSLGESKYFCLGHGLKQTEYYFWTALDAEANPSGERLIFRSLRMGGQR